MSILEQLKKAVEGKDFELVEKLFTVSNAFLLEKEVKAAEAKELQLKTLTASLDELVDAGKIKESQRNTIIKSL